MVAFSETRIATLATDGSGSSGGGFIDGNFASSLVAQNQSFGSIDIGGLNSALSNLSGQDAAFADSIRADVSAGLTPVEQGQLAAEADIVVTAQSRTVSDAEIAAHDQTNQDRPTETATFTTLRQLDVAEGYFRAQQALTGPMANDAEIATAYAETRTTLEAQDAAASAVADRAALDVAKTVIPPLDTATAIYRVGVNGEYTIENAVTLGGAALGGVLGATGKVGAAVTTSSEAIVVTERGLALTPDLLSRQGTSPLVGDFTNIQGTTVEEIISRVPSGWTIASQETGFGIRFMDESGVERLRLHGPGANAPTGSNSASGWTARVHAADGSASYHDNAGNIVGRRANEGHIPIYGNPNASR